MKEESLITKLLKNKDILFLVIIAIMLIFALKQCSNASNLKSQLEIQNLNLDALNDTVRLQKNKAGEDTYVRKTLLADKKSLEKLNKDLKEELDKQEGKVIFIERVVTRTKVDTHYVDNYLTSYGNNKFSLDWKYDTIFSVNNYRKFSGNSFFTLDTLNNNIIPGSTRINEDEFGFSFVTGLREKGKALEIFVTPRYPGMVITEIEGAVIDPHKSEILKKMFSDKKFSVGPYVGIGFGAGYGINGQPIMGPVFNLGLGIQYSIFKF
jgi:hypothetical protein